MRRRVSIAERLRKLPLSFFGKKNLSDLTSTIMDDCNALEMIFSHAVPELFAAIGSVTIIGIMLFCYNWKMSIALFWVVPAAALLIALSKKIQDHWFEGSYNARREIMEDIQEGLENVQEIRSYSGEAAYLDHFDKDCIKYEKTQIDSDVKVGMFLNSAQGILKMGLATVLITGARLWTKGEIDVFTTWYSSCAQRPSTIRFSCIQQPCRTVLRECAPAPFPRNGPNAHTTWRNRIYACQLRY
jgi:ABC-type multidrug transport system, ATPase and permease components